MCSSDLMRTGTRRPWVRRRLTEVLHLLRPPSALFGPGVLARLAWDRLAGETGAVSRRAAPLWERTDGGSRPEQLSKAELDSNWATNPLHSS